MYIRAHQGVGYLCVCVCVCTCMSRSCCNHTALHDWLKTKKKKKDLVCHTSLVHQFYTKTKEGRKLLKQAKLDAKHFHVDHIFPKSLVGAGLGVNHVSNMFLLSGNTCVCMYTCMYVYMYTCMYMYTCIHVCM
jgi:hypothetical protein